MYLKSSFVLEFSSGQPCPRKFFLRDWGTFENVALVLECSIAQYLLERGKHDLVLRINGIQVQSAPYVLERGTAAPRRRGLLSFL